MGTSQAEKTLSREKILEIAAERFREDGLTGVSVVEIMQAAGLTHGGFYKHFDSREALVAEALTRALAPAEDGGYATYQRFVREYVSRPHREMRGRGCPMAALAGEVVRTEGRTRSVFTDGVRRAIAQVGRLLGGEGKENEAQASAVFSTALGALVLSRAVDDPQLSDFILASARKALLGR
jgi:TetR/AcrR family transcriptional repressor of nem operon